MTWTTAKIDLWVTGPGDPSCAANSLVPTVPTHAADGEKLVSREKLEHKTAETPDVDTLVKGFFED